MKNFLIVVASATLAVASAGLQAGVGVIGEADFFSSISYTKIDFETNGAGDPVVLGQGSYESLAWDEYSDANVTFDQDLLFVNDSDPDFDAAQLIGGSPNNTIPGPSISSFTMYFSSSVKSFGFWVVNDETATNLPTFTAKDSGGNVIAGATVTFQGSLIDGTTGIAQYGFMGLWADEDIARVDISKERCTLDNLTFSSEIPEPATLGLLALGGLALLRRRARR